MGVIAGRKEMESQSLFQQKVLCNPKTGEPYEVWTVSQSLFQQKVLCNKRSLSQQYNKAKCHNPYFSRRFFAILEKKRKRQMTVKSQSLFQQKVLCNTCGGLIWNTITTRHNPYFSRRFFAILIQQTVHIENISHNPYFSRRFFAIIKHK